MTPAGVHGRGVPGMPMESAPTLNGWKPSESLRGSIASRTARSSRCFGSGSWTRMPWMAGSALSRATSASRIGLRRGRGEVVLLGADPDLLAVLALAAHVDGRRRVLSDPDDREAGRDPGRLERAHGLGDLAAHLRCDELSVDDHRARQYSGRRARRVPHPGRLSLRRRRPTVMVVPAHARSPPRRPTMALYRFLFAPALLAVAVLAGPRGEREPVVRADPPRVVAPAPRLAVAEAARPLGAPSPRSTSRAARRRRSRRADERGADAVGAKSRDGLARLAAARDLFATSRGHAGGVPDRIPARARVRQGGRRCHSSARSARRRSTTPASA